MSKIAFLFPGQGAQYVGMGKTLYDNFPVAKKVFEEAEEILGYDIKNLCFEGPFQKLTEPAYIQPAILTTSLAAFRVFEKEIGLKPDILLGHSFGGLTSYVCAGAISFADALRIAQKKGQYSEEAVGSLKTAMSNVKGLKADQVREICEKISQDEAEVRVGIVNSPNQVVIAGHEEAVARAEEELKNLGGSTERLRVKAPFHSSILKEATERIKKDLEKIEIKALKIPVLSAVTNEIYEGNRSEDIIRDLANSLSEEIFWMKPIEKLNEWGVDLAIEIGPQKILTNLMPEIAPRIECLTFNKFIDVEPLRKRFSLDRDAKIELIVRCLRVAVSSKNTNWNNDEYEEGVVKPYRTVKNRLLELRQKQIEPEMEDLLAAVRMVNSVLITKNILPEEIKIRLAEIFSDEYENIKEVLKAEGTIDS